MRNEGAKVSDGSFSSLGCHEVFFEIEMRIPGMRLRKGEMKIPGCDTRTCGSCMQKKKKKAVAKFE